MTQIAPGIQSPTGMTMTTFATGDQVDKIKQAKSDPGTGHDIDIEVRTLLGIFEEETLKHIADK